MSADGRPRRRRRTRALTSSRARRTGSSLASAPRAAYLPPAVRVMPPERQDPRLPSTRDVAARGARIRFVEAGDGPPLVLVHDYLASRVAWDDVLGGLSARFRVIAPDLPGFGESEKPPPSRYRYDFESFCESLADLIAAV